MSDQPELRALPKPIDIQAALVEAASLLDPAGLRPVLIGGVALAIHGIERFTKDVDLALTTTEVARAQVALGGRETRPLRIGGLSFATATGIRVDLIDRRFEFRPLFEEAIAAARQHGPFVQAGEMTIPAVPLAYLVALKMVADRPQDELDLAQLVARPELDYAAARDVVARHLGPYAARRLDRMARAARRPDAPADYENGGC